MLRLQSSMASQINGGQLNELVNTAKTCWLMPRHITINITRCRKRRVWTSTADRLEEHYRIYSATLTQMNVLLGQGNLEDMFKQNAEQKQTAMQKVYREWRRRRPRSPTKASRTMKATTNAFCGSSAVMLLVIAVIISSWIAMRRVLLLPLEEVISHIRAIAAGDLTQPIQAEGKMKWRSRAQRSGDADCAGQHGGRSA